MRVMTIVAAAALAFGAACGGPAKPVRSAKESEILARFPALEFAPAAPTYLVTTPRVTDLVTGVREAVAALGLVADFDLSAMDSAMAREFGFVPWSLDQLADAGVALDRGAVVFSNGFLPTFVVTIAAPDKLERFLAAHRPKRGLSVRRHGEREWFSLKVEDELAVQWIAWDEFLAVRLALEDDIESTAWLDALFETGRRVSRAELFDTLHGAADQLPDADIAGVFDARRVTLALFRLAPMDEQRSFSSCLRVFDAFTGSVALSADMDWSSARGALRVGLTPAAAAALREHTLGQPPGYPEVRAAAQVYASLAVDLGWLDRERKALGCPLLRDRLRLPGGLGPAFYDAFTGVYGALLEADVSGRSLRALGAVGLSQKSRAKELLDQIPQRRLLERETQIAGQAVKIVSMPMLPRLAYRVDGSGILMAVGQGVMERALAAPDGPDAGAGSAGAAWLDVASLGIRPARIPNLEDLLYTAARYLGYSSDLARTTYHRLARYEHGTVDLGLEGDDLVLRLAMGLAR